MSHVRIYTTPFCGYCRSAVRLLRSKGVDFEQIDVLGDGAKRAWLREASGRHTVPQVFAGERALGGYTELLALDADGELDAILGAEGQGDG